MSPLERPSRKPAKLSDSLHYRLNMYALAASAAGVAAFLARPAEAKVVYTPAHKWLPINSWFYLDLNHDHVNDFGLILGSRTGSRRYFARYLVVSAAAWSQTVNGAYSIKCNDVDVCAAALPKAKKVGPKSPFVRGGGGIMFTDAVQESGSSYFGPWLNLRKPAYLGLRFLINGKIHYGWARLGKISHKKRPKAELLGYAYETIPNKPIITGKTKGPELITVRPATLGGLALGRN